MAKEKNRVVHKYFLIIFVCFQDNLGNKIYMKYQNLDIIAKVSSNSDMCFCSNLSFCDQTHERNTLKYRRLNSTHSFRDVVHDCFTLLLWVYGEPAHPGIHHITERRTLVANKQRVTRKNEPISENLHSHSPKDQPSFASNAL